MKNESNLQGLTSKSSSNHTPKSLFGRSDESWTTHESGPFHLPGHQDLVMCADL